MRADNRRQNFRTQIEFSLVFAKSFREEISENSKITSPLKLPNDDAEDYDMKHPLLISRAISKGNQQNHRNFNDKMSMSFCFVLMRSGRLSLARSGFLLS